MVREGGLPIVAPAMSGAYERAYAEALRNPRAFWAAAAGEIEWLRRSRAVVDDTQPPKTSWFPGAMLNT